MAEHPMVKKYKSWEKALVETHNWVMKSIYENLPEELRPANVVLGCVAFAATCAKKINMPKEKFVRLCEAVYESAGSLPALNLRCRWCGSDLPARFKAYRHDDGWIVSGVEGRWWVYVECPNCGYQWSLWKLGVPRDAVIPKEMVEFEE